MRIAIVGGGASGLAAAWLLDEAHAVTLFEREPVLGGHVRTVGGNVPHPTLPPHVRLDTGVIEFGRDAFPMFHAWMAALGVAVRPLDGGTTNLYLADGRALHAPGAIAQEPSLLERLRDQAHLIPLLLRLRRFHRRTDALTEDQLGRAPIQRFLDDDDFSTWVRSLLMYAYSTPYEEVATLSAALAIPMLRTFLDHNRWSHLPEGVSTYVDRVEAALRGRVVRSARLRGVRRDPTGVDVLHEDGAVERFDAVVLAVPPHRVLALLCDPSEAERTWFGACTGHTIHTVLHSDTGPYDRRGVHYRAEFDLFELPSGHHGYNAYLNRLAGLSDGGPVHYGLAFELDEELDPAKVIHRQAHDVAVYSEAALAHRASVQAANGARHTWFAGAWLGDGLHEGAVRSAWEVSQRFGGRTLPGLTPGTDPR